MKGLSRVLHHVHFPGESAEYRAARNALLGEEMELRRQSSALPPTSGVAGWRHDP